MNISDLYHTRIMKTFDDDNTEIISLLKSSPQKMLKLINYFKGLPLSYPATIRSVDRGIVDLDVQAEQAFTSEQTRSVFSRSPLFKHDVFAQAQYVNIRKKAATFAKFSYVEIMAERRNFIRMELAPYPEIIIESPLGSTKGTLFDISLTGLNILMTYFFPLATGAEVKLKFNLRSIEQDLDFAVSIPATLVGIKDEYMPFNYRFTITPDKLLERQLSQFIFKRQIEIIKEIKEAVATD